MDFNELITSFSSIQSSTSFLAQTIVSAFISAMFSKRSDKKVTIYSAKIDFLNQIIYELQRDNIVTATEYLKCRNLADIAKLADEARKKQAKTTTENATDGAQHPVYDFDWFWRFFERAGYVKVFEIVLLDRESIEIEDSIDYLHDPSSETKSRLQSLDFELK